MSKQPSKPKGKGRPSSYSPELATRFCDALAVSTAAIKYVCASDPEFPSETTVYEWTNKFPEFADKYARARARQADIYIQQIIEIADNEDRDTLNSVAVSRDRLKIDTRKWIACKLLPKVYGDKATEDKASQNENMTILADALQALKDKNAKEY